MPAVILVFLSLPFGYREPNLCRRRTFAITPFLPKAKSSQEGIGVVAGSATGRQLFQFLDVSSPQDDVVGFEGGDQAGDDVRDIAPPFLLADPLQSADAHVVLVGAFPVRKMAQLHRLDDTLDNHGGTQTGPQSQEQHLAALVAPQGLHGRIVDNLDRAAEGGLIVEPDPTRDKVMRLGNRPAMQNRSRVADGHHVILPVPGKLLDSGDHLFGGQGRSGNELPRFALPGGEDFYVSPAHINNQHVHGELPNWPSRGRRSWRRSPP